MMPPTLPTPPGQAALTRSRHVHLLCPRHSPRSRLISGPATGRRAVRLRLRATWIVPEHKWPGAQPRCGEGRGACRRHRPRRARARRRLRRQDCVQVLHQFSDSSGRSLSDVLSSLALTPAGALSRIIFRDGRGAAACRSAPIAAFTGAGSRVVFICGDWFMKVGRDDAERIVIHELLHTLGLGERPPTPGQIDRAVARRCGR
jgi:hypothetical protein